jgi:hypothetical protein
MKASKVQHVVRNKRDRHPWISVHRGYHPALGQGTELLAVEALVHGKKER